MKIRVSLSDLYVKKVLLREELGKKLGKESIAKALNDFHAKRKPRPCGLTVHSVIGCSYACSYCYIPDMGFSNTIPKPYGLNKEELLYALLSNPYFYPSLIGTYLAFGSVGEPYHPIGFEKTLEYIDGIAQNLQNPIQASTKAFLKENDVERLAIFKKYPLNILVTIITVKYFKTLESAAPTPFKRFETIENLRNSGLYPVLFFRPAIPGINIDEAEEIFVEAKNRGAVGVIIGGFRVSKRILHNLKQAGFSDSEILKRARRRILKGQVEVFTRDLKEELLKIAKKIGLTPFFSACCANTFNIMLTLGKRIPCAGLCFLSKSFCTSCPVNCANIEIVVEEGEFTRSFKRILGIEPNEVKIERHTIKIYLSKKRSKISRKRVLIKVLESIYRKKIKIVHL